MNAPPTLDIGRGAPEHPIAARAGVGLFGPDALAWTVLAGDEPTDAEAHANLDAALLTGLGVTSTPASGPEAAFADDEYTIAAADLSGHVVAPGEVFRYAVLPEFRPDLTGDARFAASAVAFDVLFDDGSALSSLTPDLHGVALDPHAQSAHRFLLPDQWTRVEVSLDAAGGRTVRAIVLRVAASVPGPLRGFADGIEIARPRPLGDRPTDAVRTRRGTHSAMLYSRGLNVPAVSTPHALIMATPVTDASSPHWVYAWHEHNAPDGRPGLEALATTLIPSPWIGERAALQVMPSALPVPPVDPDERRLPFHHRDEYDRVHHYRVLLDAGAGAGASADGPPIIAEIAPARAAVAMRFTLPSGGSLLFDRLGSGAVTVTATPTGARITAYVDQVLERVPIVPRLFVWGEVTADVTATGTLPTPGRGDAAWVRIGDPGKERGSMDASPEASIALLRLGVSFLSLDHARANLAADIGNRSFDEVAARAQDEWDDALSAIEVEGATREQRITLASGLVRALMFPNTAHEFVDGEPVYASPFHASTGDTPEQTGLRAVPGLLSTNNGYWDTYRTAWPLLGLIDPRTPALADGIVQHARDSGWMTRWSAPGHVDVMVGTSSDAILADLARRGVPLDHAAALETGIRNATALPPEPAVGRKGQAHALYRSYASTSVWEGMSWTLEAAINDHALARYAGWCADTETDPARRERLRAHEEWLAGRAAVYASVFNPGTGFFQGREPDGSWRVASESFDPGVWGTDYVETNGWGMAFTAPHDGAGLAALHGGTARLAAALERFFDAREPGDESVRGSYPYQIHEISEARDQRLGQLALSNQPAHHIPAMWAFAGRPDNAHEVIREAVERLFAGPELGQGNPGDEDNGEMSAWWILNAIGLYPLIPGEPGWFITAPLFSRTRVRLAAGGVFTIATSGAGRHIAAATLDGEPWNDVWLPHDRVRAGGELRITLTDASSSWGAESAPPSASLGLPRVPVDHIVGARIVRGGSGRAAAAPADAGVEAGAEVFAGAEVQANAGVEARADAATGTEVEARAEVEAGALIDDDAETGLVLEHGDQVELTLDGRARGAASAPSIATVTIAGPAAASLRIESAAGAVSWTSVIEDEVRLTPLRLHALALPDPALGATLVRVINTGAAIEVRELELLSYEEWSAPRDAGFDRPRA